MGMSAKGSGGVPGASTAGSVGQKPSR